MDRLYVKDEYHSTLKWRGMAHEEQTLPVIDCHRRIVSGRVDGARTITKK
jgi:hypothetical protein